MDEDVEFLRRLQQASYELLDRFRPVRGMLIGGKTTAVIAEIEQVVYLRGTGAGVAGTRGEQR